MNEGLEEYSGSGGYEEEDIYNIEFRQQMLEDDEISLGEEAFMRGYDEEE